MASTQVKTQQIKVSGVDHVVLYVKDTDAAKEFYTGVLGLTVDREYRGHVFLRCGDQLVGLFDGPGKDGARSVELNHLAFRVDTGTYDDVTAALTAEGIAFHGRPGEDRCIYFSDPDGHTLQIMPTDK